MAKLTLSDDTVASLRVNGAQAHTEFFDADVPGLFVDVQRGGRKTFRVRHSVAGRIKVKTLGDTGQISLAKARAIAVELRGGNAWRSNPLPFPSIVVDAAAAPTPDMTLSEFFLDHYLPYVKSYKRSWTTDECMIRVHLVRHLGSFVMAQMKPPAIAQFVVQMREAGYAAGTCNRALVLIRYGFSLAVRWEFPGFLLNPMRDIRNLRDDNKRERFLSDAELHQLIKIVAESDNTVLVHIVLFLTYTGARKREVLDARWDDVNWDSLSWRIPITKSGKVRHIPLSKGAQRLLLERRNAQNTKKVALGDLGTPFIFANPKTLRPFVSVYYSWDTVRKKSGLAGLRMHDLRHSFASFLVNAGRSLYEVQELLGHADIRTTSRYAHLSRERLNAAVEVIAPEVPWRK